MKRFAPSFVFLFYMLATAVPTVHARNISFQTGSDLKRFVDEWASMSTKELSIDEREDVSFLQGYVAGTFDSMYGQFCPPATFGVDQALGVIQTYLDGHSDQWRKNRAWL